MLTPFKNIYMNFWLMIFDGIKKKLTVYGGGIPSPKFSSLSLSKLS